MRGSSSRTVSRRVPEQSHFEFRQVRGYGKPADAEGPAVLFGEAGRGR
jgi:hypothetical protein